MDVQSSITVINPVDGKRYKMSMKGDVARLTIRKMKRYLVSSSGIPAEEQLLKYNGVELGDDVMGGEVGITSGSTLTVERRSAGGAEPFIASPTKQALELETLDQQKTMLQHERMRREEEFRRQQDTLKMSKAQAEKRRIDLEQERQEKELELKRVQELEAAAEAERRRLDEVRQQEEEREAARVRDLDSRKMQLASERELQRQLEMQKLENERKRMLLQQQQAEYEAERVRLERERRDYQERVKKAELQIREREVELERIHIESERAKKELELEKVVLAEQRQMEYERLHQSRVVDYSAQSQLRQIGGAPPPAAAVMGRAASTSSSNTSAAAAAAPLAAQFASPAPSRRHAAPLASTPRSAALSEKQRELEELRARREALERERQAEEALDRELEAERAALEQLHGGGDLASAAAPPFGTNATPRSGSLPISAHQLAASAFPAQQQQQQQREDGYTAAAPPAATAVDARQMALDNLSFLASDIGVPTLQLDDNNTCVVSIEDRYTLLLTFDVATERLYLYSTLSTFIPKNAASKLKLYEFLLEGALLGRDMCGGGVGASLKNDFILLSTSIFLPKAHQTTLRTIVPVFVDTLVRWRGRVRDLLASCNEIVPTETASDVSNLARGPAAAPAAATGAQAAPQLPGPAGGSGPSAPEQPMLGLEVTDGVVIDGALQRYSDGVVVVQSKGPAARAGVLPNDFIRGINGRRVASLQDFQEVARTLRPHSTIPLSVDRAGSHLVISVLVGSSRQRPGEVRYKNPVKVSDAHLSAGANGPAGTQRAAYAGF